MKKRKEKIFNQKGVKNKNVESTKKNSSNNCLIEALKQLGIVDVVLKVSDENGNIESKRLSILELIENLNQNNIKNFFLMPDIKKIKGEGSIIYDQFKESNQENTCQLIDSFDYQMYISYKKTSDGDYLAHAFYQDKEKEAFIDQLGNVLDESKQIYGFIIGISVEKTD